MKKIYDLTAEPCPMNLVKFKFYFNLQEDFSIILKEDQTTAKQNITNFLNYKNALYEIELDLENILFHIRFTIHQ